jgi:biopolymer transport protein ExbB
MGESLLLSVGVLAMQGGGAAPSVPDKTLIQYIAAGGEIGYIIIGLSFTAVVFIIAALVRLRRSRLAPEEDVTALDRMLRAGSTEQAITYCSSPEHDSFITRVMGAALLRCSRSPFGLLELRTSLEESGQQEVARLHRSTDAIGLIASVTPMLGLLGTVVGMVGAFDTLSVSEGIAKPDQLAGNISVALITTVLGLVVAIPCTAVYSYLQNRVDSLVAEIGDLIEELASHVEQGAATPQAKPAAIRPPAPKPAPQGARGG